MRLILSVFLLIVSIQASAQQLHQPAAKKWADSVYNSLSEDERIGQLIVARLSSMDLKTRKITFLYDQVAEYVKKYNIGSVCLFQGGPTLQATYMNSLKQLAKTPILFSIDGEWGLGMRMPDSVMPLPRQMMLGATSDPTLIYKYGQVVANQCKRMGIQTNYAPVMDVNNNPNNPVINDRSFGQDKYKVALYGNEYMKGMQDNGIMACAKHFPGHGDVAVDSHLDLPVIYKTMDQLDSTELYPFKKAIQQNIGSVMIGHLYIPSIDDRINRPTSLSQKNIQGLLRKDIGFEGLAITDGLEMQGVKKFFPNGEASAEALIAGNDMLCLPDSIPLAIEKIKIAIQENRLKWIDIEAHCKRVLMAKYKYVLPANQPIVLENLTQDLNREVPAMRALVAANAITLLAKQDEAFFPFTPEYNQEHVAYVGVGITKDNAFAKSMREKYQATIFYFDYSKKNKDSVNALIDQIVTGHRRIVIGIHQFNRTPANNFGISADAVQFVNALQQRSRAITFSFGNPYAAQNWCIAKNLVVCYEDDSIVQQTAIKLLAGTLSYKGSLPVNVCAQYPFGYGIHDAYRALPIIHSNDSFSIRETGVRKIDSIVATGIGNKAMPGCVVLVAKNGKVIFEKAYGHYTYEQKEAVDKTAVYDLASVTKILATNLAVMKLYEEGKIDLHKQLMDYLPETKNSNKASITIEQLLQHEGGLAAYIPFYKETLDTKGQPKKELFSSSSSEEYTHRVANNLFVRNDVIDSFYNRILESPVQEAGKYLYSDNDFIFLGRIVEKLTGAPLDEYVKKTFYEPMQLESMGFHPLYHLSYNRIVPTAAETTFRNQLLRGDVHDPGAALMGGVAGHAGLFADAYDIGCIMQMLLNGGTFNQARYLHPETIQLFTRYQNNHSRRGLGFDKPEKDNATRTEPYPAAAASPETFGHLGFTGTCAWADPAHQLVFVFLSNRIHPTENDQFKKLNIRSTLLEAVYQGIAP